LFLDWILIK